MSRRMVLDEQGATLVTVMMMLLLITILGAGLLSSAVMENRIVYSLEDQKQAFYLAQAGVEYARYQLQQDLTWRVEDYTETLGQGSYTLQVQDQEEKHLQIVSIGTVGTRSKRLEVGVEYTLPSVGQKPTEILAQYSAIGGGNLYFKNAAIIDGHGDLRTNGDIYFQNHSTVDGQVIATGQVNAAIEPGQVTESAEPFPLPVIDWEDLKAQAESQGRYYSSWNNNLLDGGVNYISGSVSEKKTNLTLDGILVIRGDWELKQASTITSNTGLMIFVDGNVTFKNRMNIDAAIYATGSIQIQNKAKIQGALYAEEWIECKNNLHLTLESSHLLQPIVDSVVKEPADGGYEEEQEASMNLTYWREI